MPLLISLILYILLGPVAWGIFFWLMLNGRCTCAEPAHAGWEEMSRLAVGVDFDPGQE